MQPFSPRGTWLALTMLLAQAGALSAAPFYFNGFEVDASGWQAFGGAFNATRVSSGTNGVTSATGLFHGEGTTTAGNWGGYNFGAGNAAATVFQQYLTSVDVYLNLAATTSNDVRFDFSSAINNSSGTHLRDFVFNFGFYNSADIAGPGAGTDRFIVSAGNNSGRANSFPKNPAGDPFAISQTGWYTLQNRFYDNGGVLNVDFIIRDAANAILRTWTLGTDPIATVGGNRYGWFVNNEFARVSIDNSFLETAAAVPEPSSIALLGAGMACLSIARWRKR